MTWKTLLPLSFVALAACSFEPVSGDYLFEEVSSESDCPETDTGGDTGETEAEPVAISVNAEKTTMTIGEGDGAYDCTLDGKSYDCPTEDIVMNGADLGGYDYVYTLAMAIYGEWTSNESLDMHMDMTSTCEGTECETEYWSFPNCSASAVAEGTLVE